MATRTYYVRWLPRGFSNEIEGFGFTSQKTRSEFVKRFSDYEQNVNSRNTVRTITVREAEQELGREPGIWGSRIRGEIKALDGDKIMEYVHRGDKGELIGWGDALKSTARDILYWMNGV